MDSTSSKNGVLSLQDIPISEHYQVSFMHRSTVTHCCTSVRHGYVLTGSTDGVVKFWKRVSTTATAGPSGSAPPIAASAGASGDGTSSRCLEFVKSYSSHVGPLLALCTSQPNGDSAVSIGWDGTIKFYDVATFDVSGMIRTNNDYNSNNNKSKKFRLGRHAVLMEREDIYLLVSTRAPTRGEWKEEEHERERLKQLKLQQQQRQQNDDSSDDDDGPRPAPTDEPKKKAKKEDDSNCNNWVTPGSILLFSGTNLSAEPLRIISYHASPVTAMAYHSKKQWVLSSDVSGVLEVWNVPTSSPNDDSLSESGPLPFQSKFETDLYALMKKKTYAIDIAVSDKHFALYCSDRKIRLFSLNGCNLVCLYDERLKVYDRMLSSNSSAMGIDAIEYGKRAALEREMEDSYLLSGGVSSNAVTKQSISTVTSTSEGSNHQHFHLTFDNTGNYLLLPTIVGIKAINIQTHRVTATVGKGDASAFRFIYVTLCPGDAKVDQQLQLARMGGSSAAIKHGSEDGTAPPKNDSLLIALAYDKRRFMVFTHHDPLSNDGQDEPDEQTILARDILNEQPDASDIIDASHLGRSGNGANSSSQQLTTATQAILRTTHGDIRIKLFPKETPRTIQNFIGHAQSGYYDNVIFHRIIPSFMIQTGDPLGDGTGGESIWGGEFEDEIRRDLKHDRPFTVSMANAGPNTNGSQFFITTVPTPWLDNKHTVFGRVVGGMEVVSAIEAVKTDELDRPLSEVKILSVDVS
jgi:peptidylprolyl isomerase domain and WD repeat-containing protein 1